MVGYYTDQPPSWADELPGATNQVGCMAIHSQLSEITYIYLWFDMSREPLLAIVSHSYHYPRDRRATVSSRLRRKGNTSPGRTGEVHGFWLIIGYFTAQKTWKT